MSDLVGNPEDRFSLRRDSYNLCCFILLGTYQIPYIAMIDGITMGGVSYLLPLFLCFTAFYKVQASYSNHMVV